MIGQYAHSVFFREQKVGLRESNEPFPLLLRAGATTALFSDSPGNHVGTALLRGCKGTADFI